MHIVHLALAPDTITSLLMDWTDDQVYINESSREKRLAKLWESYREWCESAGVTDRAQKKLFSTSVLRAEGGKYIENSQKILNATSARYMLFWIASLAKQFSVSGFDGDMSLGIAVVQIEFISK